MSRRMFLIRKLNTYNMDEGESISYYLDRIKEIHDQLHDACDRISNKEMVPITLSGFSNYYEMFVNIVAGRETVPSFEKFYDIFLSKEMHKKLKNKKDSKDVALWSKTNIFGKKRQKRKGKKKTLDNHSMGLSLLHPGEISQNSNASTVIEKVTLQETILKRSLKVKRGMFNTMVRISHNLIKVIMLMELMSS
jgi:hypothetical protein